MITPLRLDLGMVLSAGNCPATGRDMKSKAAATVAATVNIGVRNRFRTIE